MYQLLLAALGAAGALLVALPSSGRLASDTSTFNGDVAATCLFDGLADTVSMTYYPNSNNLGGADTFAVVSNSNNIKLEVSAVTVNSEPGDINGSEVLAYGRILHYIPTRWITKANSTKSSSGITETIDLSESDWFMLSVGNYTATRVDNKSQVSPGQYSYTVTLSCLMP